MCRWLLAAVVAAVAPLAVPNVASAQWTGFYVGANVGYSWGKTSNSYTALDGANAPHTTTDSFSMNGAIGGGQIGFNYLFAPRWVAGIETDIQGSGEKFNGSRVACSPDPCDTHVVNQSFSEKLQWFGTVRGRAGYLVMPNWLVYGTGGIVYGKLTRDDSYNNVNTATVVTTSQSATKSGGVFGFGVESILWGNFTGRVEYLHFELPGLGSQHVTNGQLDLTQTSNRFRDDIVRVAVNYLIMPH